MDAGEAARAAAGVRYAPWTGAAIALRREQGEAGGGRFTTDVAGLEVGVDWTGRSFLLNRAGEATGEQRAWLALADLQEGACEVTSLALGAVASADEVALRQAGQGRLDEVVRLIAARVASGEISAFDLKRVQAEAERHRSELGSALAEARGLSDALRTRTGVEPPLHSPISDLPSLDVLQTAAMDGAPRLRALSRQLDAADLAWRAAKHQIAPGLALQGALRRDAVGESTPGRGFEAGVVLELPLSDGDLREIREERSNRETARAELERARAGLAERLSATWGRAYALRADDRYAHHGDDLWSEAWTRYLHGEGSLTELLDVAAVEEARDLATASWGRQVRHLDLDLACLAGTHARALLDDAMESKP